MIVKDFSTFLDDKGEVSLTERMRGSIKYGSTWYADVQSQDLVISRLQSALDDDYILLRNFNLPGLEVPIPITLLGPTGLQVIYTSSIKGIYQAKGELWLAMSSGARRFRESKPNLVNRCLLLAQAVMRHLERYEFGGLNVDAVNVFTDPGIHVDTKNPATRIVMIDALDRYIASLPNAVSVLTAEKVQKITDVLVNPPTPEFGTQYEAGEDREIEEAFASPQKQAASKVTEVKIPGGKSLRFTARQWLMLGVLMFSTVCSLAFFLLVILFYV
ncbi:MAG TPA: hypothetical protein VJ768_10455 [Anaerolineales bacterium]|nr:hypothetical protein [Anaerolineales bacterium]